MKITLSWITRKRTSEFAYSVSSFLSNCKNKSNIECVFCIDEDDVETFDAIKRIHPMITNTGVDYKIIKSERFGYSKIYQYQNIIAEQTDGDVIIYVSDDMFCLTSGWDEILINSVSPHLNEPILIMTQPVEDRNKFWPTMPSINRKWFEITKRVSSWTSSDIYLAWLAEDAELKVIKPDYEVHQISRLYSDNRDNWTIIDETHEEGRGKSINNQEERHPRKDEKGFGREQSDGDYQEDLRNLIKWRVNEKNS